LGGEVMGRRRFLRPLVRRVRRDGPALVRAHLAAERP